MKYDLLVSTDKRSYFLNCQVSGELLEVGAVYIAPLSSGHLQLESEEGVKLTVVVPLNAVNSHEELVAADTSFFIE